MGDIDMPQAQKHKTNKKETKMGFNNMFGSFANESSSSDRFFTKNGVKTVFTSDPKKAVSFAILPSLDPNNPDKATSVYPSIMPDNNLSHWGNGAHVYRGIGHGAFRDRSSVVSLKSVGEEDPVDMLIRAAKTDPDWNYLVTDVGTFGDPNRIAATLPNTQLLMFCNVFVPAEPDNAVRIGIFSKTIANKLVGENGLVFQPSMATDDQIKANYLAAFANGDITNPQSAPVFTVEKGSNNGAKSEYMLHFAVDGNRRVRRVQLPGELLAGRYDIDDLRSYLNILTPEGVVDVLIREVSGRSPAGYHEHAFLKQVLGGRFRIPDPPAAPAATRTVQSGWSTAEFVEDSVPVAPATPAAPIASIAPTVPAAPTVPQAVVPPPVAVPPPQPAGEINAAFNAAVAAGAVTPPAGHVVGDPIPKFSKENFLNNIANGGSR